MHARLKIALLVVVLTQACATVRQGRDQQVRVSTDPPGASVEIRCGAPQPPAVTPTTIRLPRRVEACSLTLTHPGFRSETVTFDRVPSKWVWANFAGPISAGAVGATRQSDQAFVDFLSGAALGGAGFAVDALTGAMWEHEPLSVERKLVPRESLSRERPSAPARESSAPLPPWDRRSGWPSRRR
jgi:hypothetical protein